MKNEKSHGYIVLTYSLIQKLRTDLNIYPTLKIKSIYNLFSLIHFWSFHYLQDDVEYVDGRDIKDSGSIEVGDDWILEMREGERMKEREGKQKQTQLGLLC